ncbi:MAG: glycosyltransferase family 39 protein [Acetatifactor sp.]|nr:glycosyltransferase family 39 protein [Acetatifactor sp.]
MRKISLKREQILFIALLLAGILIRCIQFGSLPAGVNQDEAMGAVDAWALARYGTDRFGVRLPVHFSAWQVSQMSVLLSYLMVPFLKVGGLSTVAVRLPMLLVSCGSLVLMYLVGKKLFSTKMGLLFLALTAINPWHFMQSRWSLDCNLFPHVFLLAFYLLLLGLERQRFLYLSMVFFGLTFYCYGIAVYSVIPFLVVFAVWCLRKRQLKLHQIVWSVLIFGAVALPEILVMAINLFHWETIETPIFTMGRFPESVRGNDILFLNFSLAQLGRNVWYLVSRVFLQVPDFVVNALPQFGPLYHISIPFMGIGIVTFTGKLFREQDLASKTKDLALWVFWLTGVWVGIITYEVNVNRVNIIFYPLIMLCGYGIVWLVKCLQDRWKPLPQMTAAIYGSCAVLFLFCYFTDFREESRTYYNEDFLEAVKTADQLEGYDTLYITGNMGWQFNRQMAEILTQYSCQIDALYYQEVTNLTGGRELAPYSERYHFVDMRTLDGQTPLLDDEVLFLVNQEDLEYLQFPYQILDSRGEFLTLVPAEE